MMAANMDIPQIAITNEIDDDDDDDNNLLSLVDALTDIEDIDGSVTSNDSRPRRKLMIRLDQSDHLTDLEDFEASDAEEDPEIVEHANPLSLDDMDLGDCVFEESYNAKGEPTKGQKKKLKTQMSTTHRNKAFGEGYEIFDNATDEEAFDTDDEVELEDILETNYDLNEYNTENSKISENYESHSERAGSNISDNSMKTSQFLGISAMNPKHSDLTDMEILSETDDEKSARKTRSKRRRHRVHKLSVTDLEYLDITEDDARIKKCVSKKEVKQKHKTLTKSHSLAFDSDNETNSHLPFPVCKKISEKRQGTLNIPNFENNILTDTEELDNHSESSTNPTSPTEGDAAFEEKLEAMAESYSQTAETHSEVKSRRTCEAESNQCDDVVFGNATDIDEYSTDDSEVVKQPLKKSTSFDIEFHENQFKASTHKKSKASRLIVPTQDDEALTDCENLNSSEDEDESTKMPLALVRSKSLTDEEEFLGEQEPENDLPEVKLPLATRNLIILKDNGDLPTIQILPLKEEEHMNSSKNTPFIMTDEESFSGDEDESETFHAFSKMPPMDCGVISEVQNTSKRASVREEDDLTDTEEVFIDEKRRRAPKFKHMHEKFLAIKNQLTVRNDGASRGLTDTEDLYLSEGDTEQFFSLSPLPDGFTDVENIVGTSDEENESVIRAISCTPTHMRELSGENVLALDGQGAFSQGERLAANKQLKLVPDFPVTPVYTDTEDVATSADEDPEALFRPAAATPNQLHRDMDQESSSSVHFEVKRKLDSEGCMYLKGGGYFERSTDVEEISEEDWSLEKVLVDGNMVSLNLVDGSVRFGARQEWEADKSTGLEIESPALGKDAAQKDISTAQFLTYESVLLTPKTSMPPTPSQPQYLHKTTSYTQIDAMLEKMLSEVEQQEKLFGLDLDILDPEESCINTLELHPTTDALIEVPIKKTIKKPKVYETKQELLIAEDDILYDDITFTGQPNPNPAHEYDLITFEDESKNLDEITRNIDNLVMAMEADETMLMSRQPEGLGIGYKIDLGQAELASSETLSDTYPESWNDPSEKPSEVDDGDYEFIENTPVTKAVQLHDSRTGDDIWWEGTYRNLSIVPEEDEETISLLDSHYSGRTYINKKYSPLLEEPNSSSILSSAKETSVDSSEASTSSDEGTYETCEKVVKAEVKLLVRTLDRGKEAIEIRSVKDFMECPEKKTNGTSIKDKERSKTLPSKLSQKFSNITSKFGSLLDKRKASSYSLLPEIEKPTTAESTEVKPSFTLQRLFVRNSEIENVPKRYENDLAGSKELSRSKSELLATSSRRFPLEYDPGTTHPAVSELKVDLFANIPFYPCYNEFTIRPISPTAHTTEFISNPFISNTQIPEAYCDWLQEKEDEVGGDEEGASSRAPRDSSTTTVRPEGEEGTDRDEPRYERSVTDQHQLSEEMKALLKELEKESKQ